MPAARRCPQCGTTVRPDAPEGLCPECLLHEAMKSGSELSPEAGGTATYSPGSAPPSLEELAQQFPQLEILELLGQGGMGIVYKARQPRLDRLVALKILPEEAGRDPAFAERFAREARALAKLTHPSIVTVYDFGESDGRFYLLMEFVDGVNLRHLLREGRLKPEEALQIVPQICEALQYAHEQGVIHRDIKPENILLDKRGHVKIADFGLAKLLGQKAADSALTGSRQVMGTPYYMAPEQWERPLAVDHRADIYSLGVVFYEMLTGELPLGRFAPPSQKVQVDVRLDKVVLRALEKEPERRYQHASDVKAEVEIITHVGPQRGHPAGSSDHGRPPQEVKAKELGRLVLYLLFALAIVAVGFVTANRDRLDFRPIITVLLWIHEASLEIVLGVVLVGTFFWLVWLWRRRRAGPREVNAAKIEPVPPDPEAEQRERLVLPENKVAAIKADRQKPGVILADAKDAVAAIGHEGGLPLSPSSLLNSPGTCGLLLCVLGIAASFIPAVTRHLDPDTLEYERLAPGQPAGNQRWVPVPDTGLLSWEWTSITVTFLVLGLFLIGTHSVRRMAILRGFAMLLAGTVVLVLDVVRVRNVYGSSERYTTPYVGCYLVGALAVGLLILGAIALRFALMHTNPDADAQAMKYLRRKLHALWESALSLCVGSRVKGASSKLTGDHLNDAPLSSPALEGEEAVRSDARRPGTTHKADPVGGSSIMPGDPTSNAGKSKEPHGGGGGGGGGGAGPWQ